MSSDLEDTFAAQLDAYGLTGYVREFRAIPGRRYRWDVAFVAEKVLIEINGGTWVKGGHSSGTGIKRDYAKSNIATLQGWRQFTFDGDAVMSGEALKVTEQVIKQSNKQEQK